MSIEIGLWMAPGTPVDSLFSNARACAGNITDSQWFDWSSTFIVVFDWSGGTGLDDARDPEDVFADFEHHMMVVKRWRTSVLRDQCGVVSFGGAFQRVKKRQPWNREGKNI